MNTPNNTGKRNLPGLLAFILFVVGIYLLYQLVILVAKVFVFFGYNSLFFADNLLQIRPFHPAVTWGVLGLFFGALVGVCIAIKKYKLSGILVLYPVGGILIFLTIMGLVNKPLHYDGDLELPAANSSVSDSSLNNRVNNSPRSRYLYKAILDVKVHNAPSVSSGVVYVLKSGTEIELLERRLFDKNNVEWLKVGYNGQEGYVTSRSLQFSKTGYY